jgi:mitogen-activated protein kinase 1/3
VDEYEDQIQKIINVLGTPAASDIDYLPEQHPTRQFLAQFECTSRKSWKDMCPTATPLALELIQGLLVYHPNQRLSVHEALKSEFFSELEYMYEEHSWAVHKIDWDFDSFQPNDKRQLQNLLYLECAAFHPFLLKRDEAILADKGISAEMLRSNSNSRKGSKTSVVHPTSIAERPRVRVGSDRDNGNNNEQGCCNVM